MDGSETRFKSSDGKNWSLSPWKCFWLQTNVGRRWFWFQCFGSRTCILVFRPRPHPTPHTSWTASDLVDGSGPGFGVTQDRKSCSRHSGWRSTVIMMSQQRLEDSRTRRRRGQDLDLNLDVMRVTGGLRCVRVQVVFWSWVRALIIAPRLPAEPVHFRVKRSASSWQAHHVTSDITAHLK